MPPTILATDIRRQMDHCILALSGSPAPGGGRPDAFVSLYWIGFTTEPGAPMSGHLAWVWAAGHDGASPTARLLTDSLELATGLADRTRPGRWDLGDVWPAPEPATFVRSVTQPLAHTWHVTAADDWTLEATWADLGDPVFATGPTRDGTSAITTVLVSAREATLSLGGVRIPGRPYPDPIWTPWFGAEQTSCVMGLGEVIHAPIAPRDQAGQ